MKKQTTNNYRITFTYYDLVNGNMVICNGSTKWMTLEEAQKSSFMNKEDAQIVERGCDG